MKRALKLFRDSVDVLDAALRGVLVRHGPLWAREPYERISVAVRRVVIGPTCGKSFDDGTRCGLRAGHKGTHAAEGFQGTSWGGWRRL